MSELVADIPVRRVSDHTYFSMTKSLCRVCKKSVDAKIVFRDDAVWFDKFCPEHGAQEVIVSSSAEWYLDCLTFLAPNRPPKTVKTEVSAEGCPFDCGPCASHQQKIYLPVVPITSACNLDCPICYTVNKNDAAHRLSREDMGLILKHLLDDHEELDIINFTGGGREERVTSWGCRRFCTSATPFVIGPRPPSSGIGVARRTFMFGCTLQKPQVELNSRNRSSLLRRKS